MLTVKRDRGSNTFNCVSGTEVFMFTGMFNKLCFCCNMLLCECVSTLKLKKRQLKDITGKQTPPRPIPTTSPDKNVIIPKAAIAPAKTVTLNARKTDLL